MRRELLPHGAGRLKYEIREIVNLAHRVRDLGIPITWENIGDPIQKGEPLPAWIKEKIHKLADDDLSYSYSSTQGAPEARAFVTEMVAQRGDMKLDPDDVIFFNGLGDAVAKLFNYLHRDTRVIGPTPAYSTHASIEAAHADDNPITYALDPERDWLPDLDDLEQQVESHPSIAGLLIINPGNPTGSVLPREVLEGMVDIARRHQLFVISDEIYAGLEFPGVETAALSEVIGDVPGIALRGISKIYPWPGARCGWAEVYNRNDRPAFARYINGLINARMLEVSSTSLPQLSIPEVMGDSRFETHLKDRSRRYAERAEEARSIFNPVDGVHVVQPHGAFYMTVLFEDGVLNGQHRLPLRSKELEKLVDDHVHDVAPDKRFVSYLLASEGICVVPLSGFSSDRCGFRMTLLEADDEKRHKTWKTMAKAIDTYLKSGKKHTDVAAAASQKTAG